MILSGNDARAALHGDIQLMVLALALMRVLMAAVRWPLIMAGAGVAAIGAALLARAKPREVGAWTTLADVHAANIARAKRLGVTRMCIFVNGQPTWDTPWGMRDRASIKAAVAACKAAGLKITLVSWMTPRPDWIAGAVEFGALAAECQVDEAEYDLEEQWTVLRSRSDAQIEAVSAQLATNTRQHFRGKLCIDFIIGTDMRVMRHMLQRSDVHIPQVYATLKNTQIPGYTQPGSLEAGAFRKFSAFGKEVVIGVAAFRQEGAYGGLGYLDATRVSLDAITALGVRRIRVWWLPTIDEHEGALFTAWRDRKDPGAVA